MDFTPETLPILDHYLRQTRDLAPHRPESLPLVTTAAGVYIGEVLRRRYACAWVQDDDDDSLGWYLAFEDHELTVFPVAIAHIAIHGEDADREIETLRFKDDERDLVANHLADLPAVETEEYLSPSTRVEVVDIAIDLIRAYREAASQDETPAESD